MNNSDSRISRLMEDARQGSETAIASLFTQYREQLKRMVWLRMDRRLQGRVDPSDIVQEAYMDVSRRFSEYAASSTMPILLWFRMLVGERMLKFHRDHLETQKRDVNREVSVRRIKLPDASSISLACGLANDSPSATSAAIRDELQTILHQALERLEPIDREIIALRHYEEVTNVEAAAILELSVTAASNRYIRAIRRLRSELGTFADSLF